MRGTKIAIFCVCSNSWRNFKFKKVTSRYQASASREHISKSFYRCCRSSCAMDFHFKSWPLPCLLCILDLTGNPFVPRVTPRSDPAVRISSECAMAPQQQQPISPFDSGLVPFVHIPGLGEPFSTKKTKSQIPITLRLSNANRPRIRDSQTTLCTLL
ncbi:hypothetical protein M413DRAFT_165709 [Hebeloma cylindrosporum]|uniref:Uncharacterized protein n=1 Tax=Hebeloma cylindrosporum TaxID=76867 RepID=A0A0C3C8W9_HEBCY|nr:hypothetical protein M413DRAFT_165709 [Hebeloma cylindrosporum h7]